MVSNPTLTQNLMTHQPTQSEDLTSSILDFQANYVRLIHKRKTTLVDMDNEAHRNVLGFLWSGARTVEGREGGMNGVGGHGMNGYSVNGMNGAGGGRGGGGNSWGERGSDESGGGGGDGGGYSEGVIKWRLLGFESEDVTEEFGDVGMLGLDCLVSLSSLHSYADLTSFDHS